MKLDIEIFDEEKEYAPYVPNNKEKKIIDYVNKRFSAMQSARTVVDKDRGIYQTMIDATRKPYPDKRSSSNVPLASTLVEQFVAEAIKIPSEFNFKGETESSKANARALEHVRKYDWRKNNRKHVTVDDEYLCAAFGTSIIFSGYEYCKSTQKDFDGMNADSTFNRVTKDITESQIILKNINIQNFWMDNRSISGIEDAGDCIYRQWVSFETIIKWKNSGSKLYSNLDSVSPREYSNEYKTAITKEESNKRGEFVLLQHYWSVDKDCYILLANSILIRSHPMIDTINGKKALPFVVRTLGKKIWSIYGRGLCEASLMFNSEINNLRELIMDSVKRSNTQVLALGNGLSRTGRAFAYDNEVMTFDGDLNSNSFQQISGTPPNSAIFELITQVYRDIAIFVGIDIQNILGTPNKTAFEVEVQRISSQKRINNWIVNRDLAYERLANLHRDKLQTFFSAEEGEGLLEIEIEGEKPVEAGGKLVKFTKKKGNHILKVKPSYLRGDFFVDVFTNTQATTINAVDRQQKIEAMGLIGPLTQSYGTAKQMGYDLEKFLPYEKTVTDILEGFGIDTESKGDQGEVQERQSEILGELQSMMSRGQPVQPMQEGQPMQDTNLTPNPTPGATIQ